MTIVSVSVEHLHRLEKLFGKRPVAVLAAMQRALGTSGRTVLRALSKLGYLTSYSHAGRYYTLQRIPSFDPHGLWFYGEARFSTHGTLRATIVILVKQSAAGYTHQELQQVVGLRVHDTLRSLVEDAQIGREQVQAVFVYVDIEPERAAAQLAQRRKAQQASAPVSATELARDPSQVIDILVAIIHHPKYALSRIVAELQSRGKEITEAQVEQVLLTYGVKKTAHSRSRRSRPCARRPPR